MQVLKFSFSHLYQNSRDSYRNNVIENLFSVSHKVKLCEQDLIAKKSQLSVQVFKFSFSHMYQNSGHGNRPVKKLACYRMQMSYDITFIKLQKKN